MDRRFDADLTCLTVSYTGHCGCSLRRRSQYSVVSLSEQQLVGLSHDLLSFGNAVWVEDVSCLPTVHTADVDLEVRVRRTWNHHRPQIFVLRSNCVAWSLLPIAQVLGTGPFHLKWQRYVA